MFHFGALERIANECTAPSDSFNRPSCGAVLTGAVATGSLAPGRYRSRYRTGALLPVHPIEIRSKVSVNPLYPRHQRSMNA
jgi:hypothetical protein